MVLCTPLQMTLKLNDSFNLISEIQTKIQSNISCSDFIASTSIQAEHMCVHSSYDHDIIIYICTGS